MSCEYPRKRYRQKYFPAYLTTESFFNTFCTGVPWNIYFFHVHLIEVPHLQMTTWMLRRTISSAWGESLAPQLPGQCSSKLQPITTAPDIISITCVLVVSQSKGKLTFFFFKSFSDCTEPNWDQTSGSCTGPPLCVCIPRQDLSHTSWPAQPAAKRLHA